MEKKLVQIEYSKNSVKYINAVDKPMKKRLKEAIEKIHIIPRGQAYKRL